MPDLKAPTDSFVAITFNVVDSLDMATQREKCAAIFPVK